MNKPYRTDIERSQAEKAAAEALIARGKAIQDAENRRRETNAYHRQNEAVQQAQHAAWVRRQNELRSQEWRAREQGKLRQELEEKERQRVEYEEEERKVAQYREKLRKGRER